MTKFKDMKFVIGVDSGGTHYRIKACDLPENALDIQKELLQIIII